MRHSIHFRHFATFATGPYPKGLPHPEQKAPTFHTLHRHRKKSGVLPPTPNTYTTSSTKQNANNDTNTNITNNNHRHNYTYISYYPAFTSFSYYHRQHLTHTHTSSTPRFISFIATTLFTLTRKKISHPQYTLQKCISHLLTCSTRLTRIHPKISDVCSFKITKP